PLVLFTVQPAVVVRDAVQLEVVDQSVEADRDPGAPGEVVLVDRVVQHEDLAGQLHPVGDLVVGHGEHPLPQVVELKHLDVRAEGGGQQGEVGGDVEHARVEVAHQPVPGGAQRGPDV